MIVTRFAPSPTGRLHVGNIRAALHNWMCARQAGGRFLLRLDDTDLARSTEENAQAIREDLRWLGLDPDDAVRQSERFALYEERFEKLRHDRRVYPCYETQDELDLKRKILAGRGLPPVYDRAALQLTDAERTAFEAEGRTPHWRFLLDHDEAIAWTDLIRGEQHLDPKVISDPVIRRADGSWLYMLPSVIDDIDMGITHVVRGEDHATNTGLQLQMFTALGSRPPAFAHEALLTGSEGKLSKRLGSLGCDAFRQQGLEPIAIKALLARVGTSDPVEPVIDMAPLIARFTFGRFGRAPARFDAQELAALNARIIHQLPYEAVSDRLPAGLDRIGWEAIRPNLKTVGEAADWWKVVEGPIESRIGEADRAYLAQACEVAASLDWSADPWHALTNGLKEKTDRKGKLLFLPLRQALTGLDHGPDMVALLPLIGRHRALARLRAAAELSDESHDR
jgi:glutamyl-tRNA synthetase